MLYISTAKRLWIYIFLFVVFFVRLLASCSSFSACSQTKPQTLSIKKLPIYDQIKYLQREISFDTRKYLSPENSVLTLGMVVGLNELYYFPKLQHALRDTGTIHVVVVSGFNISLVYGMLLKLLGTKYNPKIVYFSILLTLGYSILTGFEPPIIRAWFMSSVGLLFSLVGRNVSALQLLIFSGLVLLSIEPIYLFSLSFQLSFIATFGLIYYGDFIKSLLKIKSKNIIIEDLVATCSAQVFVFPILAYNFGTFSLSGFITNPLILWLVPIITVLGSIFILVIWVLPLLAVLLSYVIEALSDVFLFLIYLFSDLLSAWNIEIVLTPKFIFIYYLCLLALPLLFQNRKKKGS